MIGSGSGMGSGSAARSSSGLSGGKPPGQPCASPNYEYEPRTNNDKKRIRPTCELVRTTRANYEPELSRELRDAARRDAPL